MHNETKVNDTKCLILIDVQKGIFKLKQSVFNQDILIKNLQIILEKARKEGFLIIFTQHENKTYLKRNTVDWEIIGEVEPIPSETTVYKSHPSVFEDTQLEAILKREDVKNLYLCGLISNGCVKQACEDAIEKGYNITLISDAHSTFNKNPERIINELNKRVLSIGGQTKNTENFINNGNV